MVNPCDVLDKLLDIKATGVTAREIIGVSHNLSTALADLTKVKGVPVILATPTVQVHHARDSIDQQALLELPVVIGNNTYIAIIDSGSQVNIIRDDVYRNNVKVPKVTNVEMSLRNANGGDNVLIGLVPNLEIWIGALKT